MSGLANTFRQAGTNAGAAFAQGIASQADAVAAAAAKLAGAASSSLTAALDIHSPSRVFMEFGEYTGEGFALGMEASLGKIAQTMDKLTNIVGGYSGKFSASAIGGFAGGGVSTTTNTQTINFNQPLSSPYQVSRQLERTMQEMLYGI